MEQNGLRPLKPKRKPTYAKASVGEGGEHRARTGDLPE